MKPRLKQPLFHPDYYPSYNEGSLSETAVDLIRAYDCIWNLLYSPADITRKHLMENARINLEALGGKLELLLSEKAFDTSYKTQDLV